MNNNYNHKHRKIKFDHDKVGELVVVGHNKYETVLGHHHPKEICVDFVDECEIVPCSPHHFDALEFDIHYKEHKYVLIIRWNVSAVREIVWAVKF